MTGNRNHAMLCLTSDHWSLRSVPGDALIGSGTWTVAEAESVAQQITSCLAEQEVAPGPLLISIDSSLCLATQFTVASVRQLRKREALLFLLEETLPISAEEIVADFVVQQRFVFAVVAETAALEPLVVELTRAGFYVEAIVSEVILACEEHLRAEDWPARHQVLWLEDRHWELLTVDGSKPTAWERLPATYDALVKSLRAAELVASEQLPLVAYGPSAMIADVQALISAPWLSVERETVPHTLAVQSGRTATRILDGQLDPPLQLLRGPLAASVKRKHPLRVEWRLVQSAVAMLLLACAATQYRHWQTAQQELAAHVAGQADLFRDLYPDKRVPVGVQTRLASDLRRLRGVRGETTELPSGVEALTVVQQVLAALPADLRFRLLEIRVEHGRLSLSGEVRSHGDADRIAAALRKQGLRVSPPSTQQLPQQGVDFRLTADIVPAQEKSA